MYPKRWGNLTAGVFFERVLIKARSYQRGRTAALEEKSKRSFLILDTAALSVALQYYLCPAVHTRLLLSLLRTPHLLVLYMVASVVVLRRGKEGYGMRSVEGGSVETRARDRPVCLLATARAGWSWHAA